MNGGRVVHRAWSPPVGLHGTMNPNAFCKNSPCSAATAESPVPDTSNIATKSNLKRWNSVPMDVNFSYPETAALSPEPISTSSSSSNSSSLEETMINKTSLTTNMAEVTTVKNYEHSFYLIARRHTNAADSSPFRHRFSTGITSPVSGRIRDRGIEKLKREADVKRCIQEDYADEKFSLTGAAVMESLDELGIDEAMLSPEGRKRTQSLTEPVHVLTNFLHFPCSSSPTRPEKQFYSPSMQQVVRGSALSTSTSPSPSQQQCMRSLSPIAARSFSLKRRYDSETEGSSSPSPAKRIFSSLPATPPTFGLQDRFPRTSHRSIDNSWSLNSVDSESSNSTISGMYTNPAGQQSSSLTNQNTPSQQSTASIFNSSINPHDADVDMESAD